MITKQGFIKNIEVKYSEMDYNLALKPSALLNYLQDFASENAENLGFGYSYITKQNLMWFLLKYRMEFDEYPTGIYDLTVKTEPRGYSKLFAFRDFELYEKGKRLGKIASTWSLVDVTNKSLASMEKVLNNAEMPPFEKREDDLKYEKIRVPEQVNIEKIFEVRYNDIDVNSHANNGNYIIWAFEPLSFEFKSNHTLKSLDMVFKKEIKYGEKLVSQVSFKDEKTTVHVLKNSKTGDDLCLLNCEWRET